MSILERTDMQCNVYLCSLVCVCVYIPLRYVPSSDEQTIRIVLYTHSPAHTIKCRVTIPKMLRICAPSILSMRTFAHTPNNHIINTLRLIRAIN